VSGLSGGMVGVVADEGFGEALTVEPALGEVVVLG
jgi:hypothetical protein